MEEKLLDLFLRACRREPVERTPVWFMRQAGRYQAEYRKIREKYTLMEICQHPEVAAEVTLLPIKQLGVDAAILFSDIMVPVHEAGIAVDIQPNVGPVIEEPIRESSDVDRLRPLVPEEDVPYVIETIRILQGELKVPLIGFAGGPFTLASYLVEGRPTRKFHKVKHMMFAMPDVWHRLMDRLCEIVIPFLEAQVQAGVQALQLFDSWAGCLSPQDYEEFVLPYSKRIFDAVTPLGVPKIHFGVGTAELLTLLRDAGADVVGVDWVTPLDEAWRRIGYDTAVQGNLEPNLLLAPMDRVLDRTRDVMRRAGGRPGHIFNLGHGVLPQTNPDTLKRIVETVHTYRHEEDA